MVSFVWFYGDDQLISLDRNAPVTSTAVQVDKEEKSPS